MSFNSWLTFTDTSAVVDSSLILAATDMQLFGDLDVSGNLDISGNINCSGTINGGSSSSSLVPTEDNVYNLGADSSRWANLYLGSDADISGNVNIHSNLFIDGNIDISGSNTLSGLSASRALILNSSKVISGVALNNGQLLVGSTGVVPVAANLTGTTNQITVTNGAGSITLSTPQNINTSATPIFASETLSATSNQIILGTTNTTTISATAPAASRVYTIPDALANASFVMSENSSTINGTKTFGSAPVFSSANTSSVLYANGSKTLSSVALSNGQLLIGAIGGNPVASTLTGTANQISINNASGSITISTPQNIGTSSTPTFASETLSATTNQIILGTTNTTTISATAPSASRVYTIPDAGGSANFVMTSGVQSIGGVKTFTSAMGLYAASNQLVFQPNGSGFAFNITAANPAADRFFTLPDVGSSDFVMTGGTQTLSGAKTFSSAPTLTAASNGLVFQPSGAGNTYSLTCSGTPASSRVLSFNDPLADARIILSSRVTTTPQSPNITSTVTVNGASGSITTASTTLAAQTATSFTFNNSVVTSASLVMVCINNYSGTYDTNGFPVISVGTVGTGSFIINLVNAHLVNALSGTLIIRFIIC